MKIEQQVVSLELAKQLKEAGFKQDSKWWWWVNKLSPKSKPSVSYYGDNKPIKDWECIAAPTVAELGERLPNRCKTRWFTEQVSGLSSWVCRLWDCDADGKATFGQNFFADTEANARAKMWLYLKKENLL